MQKRTRSILAGLVLVFAAGVAAVIAAGMLASRRDSAVVQRVVGRGSEAVARYEEQFTAKKVPAKAQSPADERAGAQSVTHSPVGGEEPPAKPLPATELFNKLGPDAQSVESQQDYENIENLVEAKGWSEWTGEDSQFLSEFFGKNAGLLEEIRRLAGLGEPVYHVDLSKGYATELPHLAQLRSMARLLRSEAALRASAGNIQGAMEDYEAIIGLGETLVEEPIIISQLVRIAMMGILFQGMGSALTPGQLTPEQARAFVDGTAGMYHREALVNALVTEATFGTEAMENFRNGQVFPDVPSEANAVLGFIYQTPIGGIMLSSDRQNYAEFMERLAQAAQAPYYEVQAELEAIDSEVDDLSILNVMTPILVPALTRVEGAQARSEAMLDLTRIGLSLEAYYTETGNYPENLNVVARDLGGSVPLDPYTGNSYVYRPAGETFTLYSVGENRQDDGGRHHFREGDIVWRGVEVELEQKE